MTKDTFRQICTNGAQVGVEIGSTEVDEPGDRLGEKLKVSEKRNFWLRGKGSRSSSNSSS